VKRVDGEEVDIDAIDRADPATFALVQSTRTLGCFQIESPGQRELVGKFAPETFEDLIIDLSLFRPGPVKSDMIVPFLRARQGWAEPEYLHEDLRGALGETWGVVVFHEQVLQILHVFTGCSLAQADEVRRTLGTVDGQALMREEFYTRALRKGYTLPEVEKVWEVLKAFASFGFCKAHAAAFALPTYQSAWLKAHHPAAFLAGVLTHDPGMYPKRLILDDARQMGIAVLGLDVNVSEDVYRIERVAAWDEPPPGILGAPPRAMPTVPGVPDGREYGIRLSLTDVKGINASEVASIVAGRPYATLSDFWHRAGVSRPVVERLVVAGAFDSLYGIGGPSAGIPVRRRGRVTRRDLLLQVADLDRWTRSVAAGNRTGRGARRGRVTTTPRPEATVAGADSSGMGIAGPGATATITGAVSDVAVLAARQSKASAPVRPVDVQLTLDLGDAPETTEPSGLAEMTGAERVRAELEVLGLDVSRHVVDFYSPLLDALGVTRSRELLGARSRSQVFIAGVKVATQTPPIRSGRRVVFLTLDDATGPVDATFFEDAQGPYAATVFHSWLLLVRGVIRRTGPRGVSVRATGAWELPVLQAAWESGGVAAVEAIVLASELVDDGWRRAGPDAVAGAAQSRASRPVIARPPGAGQTGYEPRHYVPAGGAPDSEVTEVTEDGSGEAKGPGEHRPAAARHGDDAPVAGGMGQRRVLVHASGYRQSPYADVKPPGEDSKKPPRKLWHSSPGSSGG
jgi:error-prone DNA polymerase